MSIVYLIICFVCAALCCFAVFRAKQASGRYQLNKAMVSIGEGSFKEGAKAFVMFYVWGALALALAGGAVGAYRAAAGDDSKGSGLDAQINSKTVTVQEPQQTPSNETDSKPAPDSNAQNNSEQETKYILTK